MTDVFDRAAALEELERQEALQRQEERAGLKGKTVKDSAYTCRVCGRKIPDGRREVLPGVQTCVACQTELDHALGACR